ncbi:MAG: SDR family oxidoreductase [Thalassobaculales bacterium]
MKVVITGGAGFLGRRLGLELLRRGRLTGPSGREEAVERVVLFDVVPAEQLPEGDNRLEVRVGDVADRAQMRDLIDAGTGSVFHFAGVVSAGAEADFDLGYRVNLDGTLAVLEAARALERPARLVFTSSLATYGGDYASGLVGDATPLTPQTSYGTQKAIGELLVNDYARKGFVDGRSLRLPTIFVRPGKPNKAASTFFSSIVRDPLQGEEAVCPVDDTVSMAVLSPRKAVEAFIHAHELPGAAWGAYRGCMLPSITVSVQEALAAVEKLGGAAARARVRFEPDPLIRRIVAGWPQGTSHAKALKLGFSHDEDAEAIVRAFIEDDMVKKA